MRTSTTVAALTLSLTNLTAIAQESDDSHPTLQEVVVTERRPFVDGNMDIVRTRDDPQAYTIFDQAAIQDSAAVNVEEFLKQRLTTNTTARNNSQNSLSLFGTTSSINLRGLGAAQTLVLVNGRRMASVSIFGEVRQADLNGIPLAAIERIETLPSSASAIYGGGAVGGVVNVILKRNFEGGQVSTSYENTFSSSAPIRTVDAAYGTMFEEGRTSVLLAAHYSDGESLQNQDRSGIFRGVRRVLTNTPELLASGVEPFYAGATPNIASLDGSDLVLRPEYGGASLGSSFTHIAPGTAPGTLPTELGASLLANAGAYNTDLAPSHAFWNGRLAPLTAAPTVRSVVATVRRQMTTDLELFSEFSYSSNATSVLTGRAWSSSYVTVPADAPTNPFQQDVVLAFPYDQPARYRADNVNRRVVTGFMYSLPNDWMLEGDYTWSSSKLTWGNPYADYSSLPGAFASGALNPFVDTMAYSPDVGSYFGYDRYDGDPSTLNDVGLRAAGPLWRSAAGTAMLAVGLEHRKEGIGNTAETALYPNNPEQNQSYLFIGKSQTADSAYAEIKIPLIGEANGVPGVRQLDVQAAVRTERFEVNTGTSMIFGPGSSPTYLSFNTDRLVQSQVKYDSTDYTFAVRYQPFEGLTLRGGIATAFLPTSYAQLLANRVSIDTLNVVDPRRGGEVTQVRWISGGNPDLKPTDSRDWNFGVIYQPSFVPGLRINAEWYRIEQENVIVEPAFQQIVADESRFPGRVTREPVAPGDPFGVGPIAVVDYTLLNANELTTEGIDIALDYHWRSERFGGFAFSLAATHITNYRQQLGALDAPVVDIVNHVALGGPLQNKANASLSWNQRNWTLGWSTTYYGSYDQYLAGTDAYVRAQGSTTIPHQTYHDAFARYEFDAEEGALAGVTVQLGVKNVFDKLPPLDVYYSTYYSPFGDPRQASYWLSLEKRL